MITGRYRDRWPTQPWTYPLADLRPQGEPETQVFTGTSILLALHVRGLPTDELLAVRWDGGPTSAAIATGGTWNDDAD